MISAIVLAAGTSSRMGSINKLLLDVQGHALVRHSVQTVLASKADEVIVVTGHQQPAIEHALQNLPITLAHNPYYTYGRAWSVAAGIGVASDMAEAFMICLADLALLSANDINHTMARFKALQSTTAHYIVRPVYDGKPAHPVIWPARYRHSLTNPAIRHEQTQVTLQYSRQIRHFPAQNKHGIQDIDTPADYQRLHANLKQSV